MRRKKWVAAIGLAAALVLMLPSAAEASFPGANGKLLYSANDEAGDYWIATSPPPFTTETQLTDVSLQADGAIWSPDGRTIAFDSNNAIWMMNADGSTQRQVIPQPQIGYVEVSGFSPSGGQILYTKVDRRVTAIWEANVNGTGRHVVKAPPNSLIEYYGAKFSPRGKWIAFVRDTCTRTTCRNQVMRMTAAGTNLANLSKNRRDDSEPDWSPTGTKIVFRRVVTTQGFAGIFTMTASGANQTEIARPRADVANYGAPTWSPDGRFIVFNKATIDGTSIYRMRPNGANKTLLVFGLHGVEEADGPSLQPIP